MGNCLCSCCQDKVCGHVRLLFFARMHSSSCDLHRLSLCVVRPFPKCNAIFFQFSILGTLSRAILQDADHGDKEGILQDEPVQASPYNASGLLMKMAHSLRQAKPNHSFLHLLVDSISKCVRSIFECQTRFALPATGSSPDVAFLAMQARPLATVRVRIDSLSGMQSCAAERRPSPRERGQQTSFCRNTSAS